MLTNRLARALLASGALAALAFTAGCSKGSDSVSSGTTQPATTAAPGADAASAGGAKAPCDAAALVPVIQQKFGPAGVDHLVCLVPNAVLTVKTGGDDTVAFLVQKGGAWAIAADGPTADADKLLPPSFPSSLVRTWQDKRAPVTATPNTARKKPAAGIPPGPGSNGAVCTGEGGDVKCVTTLPPTVPTTKPPTTKAPTTTAPPVTTAAPPTTFSQFCIENPLDPSCSGKK